MLKTKLIEQYRIRNGLTKTALAKKFGMLPSNYTMMMISKSTTLKSLYKIAKVVKIKAKDLLL
jgi:transcriptional regulator with XRE-family HTH domain